MIQTPYAVKNKVEIILDVCHFDLPPRMAIVFFVHSLHITKMAMWNINEGEFEKNIKIKCRYNARNILNLECIIV
jgi:hypothetical protein